LSPQPSPHLSPQSSLHGTTSLLHASLHEEDQHDDDSTLSEVDSHVFEISASDDESIADSGSDESETDVDEHDLDEQNGEDVLDDEPEPTNLNARETLKRTLIDETADDDETEVDETDDILDGKTLEDPFFRQGMLDPDSIPVETDEFIAQLENTRADNPIEATPLPDPEFIRQPGEEMEKTIRKAMSVPTILSADVAGYMALLSGKRQNINGYAIFGVMNTYRK